MDYRSGINPDHIKAEYLADLERRHAQAELDVYAAISDEEIRSAAARRDELARRIHNVGQGGNRDEVIDLALTPPEPVKRRRLTRK